VSRVETRAGRATVQRTDVLLPVWEAFANAPDASREPDRGSGTPTRSPEVRADPSAVPTVSAIDESELLALALEVAARKGDPNPELVQHARGSRFEVTRTTGSIVFSDVPSYIIVMKGNFRARRASRPGHRYPDDEQSVSDPFQTLVIDIETGQITDSGSSNHCPDLASLGEIVTDHGAC
jgi:hypothetical protein